MKGESWLTDLCEETREQIHAEIVRRAQELGANAILGYRYDATVLQIGGTSEVLCYGTAVAIARNP